MFILTKTYFFLYGIFLDFLYEGIFSSCRTKKTDILMVSKFGGQVFLFFFFSHLGLIRAGCGRVGGGTSSYKQVQHIFMVYSLSLFSFLRPLPPRGEMI